ncbi:MAG: YebC/PmpR family DNA-binding transcriptional regulator [Phycisphaerae bacterium]|nr:YebC/PmpR family DNA-binding transcriptional regulator [Phycisphaerae bacterium]
MAGHSHWARIKRKKGANDIKRGKLWSKLARQIIIAAKNGADPNANLALRYAVDKAKEANMPNDTIDRAIKKGSGELGTINYENVTYEGYGPGSVAILINCLTDNRNRTAPEIRKLFETRGCALGSPGCVAWMFESKGIINIDTSATTEDKLMDVALDAGADDITQDDDTFEVTCDPANFENVKKAIKDAKIEIQSADLTMIPQNTVKLEGDDAKKLLDMIDAIEDHDDVQNVYANFEITDEVLENS